MEGYMWLILASMFAVGLVFGYFFSRSSGVDPTPRLKAMEVESKALEAKLEEAKAEKEAYQAEVSEHFGKTAELFNRMTNDYRDVYEHLAASSDKLCGDDAVKLKSLSSDAKVLEAEAVQENEPEAESEATAAQASEEAPEASSKSKADEVTPEVAEAAVAAEEKASEARTVH